MPWPEYIDPPRIDLPLNDVKPLGSPWNAANGPLLTLAAELRVLRGEETQL
jgi:hypothetical protein